MRVAVIDPSLFTPTYDQEIVQALARTGNDVLLFGKALPAKDPLTRDPLLRQHFYLGLAGKFWTKVPRSALRVVKGISHFEAMARLARVLKRWSPDVIHFQWLPLPALDVRFLPLLRRIAPLVLTVHDTMPFNGAPGSSLQAVGFLDALRAFDHLIVHTDQGVSRVAAHLGRADRIARIPHGLLYDVSATRPPRRAARDAEGRVTFLLLGMVKPYKGIDVMIRALARLAPETRAQCRVRVVGQAHMDTAPLLALARELGVSDTISFDFRFIPDEEMVSQLDDSTVLAFPYREIEASGVLMAGIARSRPLIASRLGAFGELIEDGRQGLLLPPGDEVALATALERVIAEPGLLDRITDGMETMRTSIPSWDGIAGRTVEVYEAAHRHWQRGARAVADPERPAEEPSASPLPR
jgi:glycosyltransferase involved in cell wall biosynthesis